MTNNDILRRLRYTFDLNDNRMIEVFALAMCKVTRAEISNWLKKEEDENFQKLSDIRLAAFLDGLINDKRGKREGAQPKPEKRLSRNAILRKLKIALNLKDDDMLELFSSVNQRMSKHELSAFFRKSDHRNYRECQGQILRNFLNALQIKFRPESADNIKAKKAEKPEKKAAAPVVDPSSPWHKKK